LRFGQDAVTVRRMMISTRLSRRVVIVLVVTWATAIVAGCSSKPKVDWNARIRNYSYDQAVLDMGPPDRSSTLSDGSMVAEWYQGTSSRMSFGFGVGSYGSGGGVSVGQGVSTGGQGRYLRLTFDSLGQLTAWGKVDR
jgi:uncharacterized membrane protein YgcG